MDEKKKTTIKRFVFDEADPKAARERMIEELRVLLDQLRSPDASTHFKRLTIRYTDGAVDEYVACDEPCLIMQELAE